MKIYAEIIKLELDKKAYPIPMVNVFWYCTQKERHRIKGKVALAMTLGLRPDYNTILHFKIEQQSVEEILDYMNNLPEMDPVLAGGLKELTAYWNPLEDFEVMLSKWIDIVISSKEKDGDDPDTVAIWKQAQADVSEGSEWSFK